MKERCHLYIDPKAIRGIREIAVESGESASELIGIALRMYLWKYRELKKPSKDGSIPIANVLERLEMEGKLVPEWRDADKEKKGE